jgi:hypothetical protein
MLTRKVCKSDIATNETHSTITVRRLHVLAKIFFYITIFVIFIGMLTP